MSFDMSEDDPVKLIFNSIALGIPEAIEHIDSALLSDPAAYKSVRSTIIRQLVNNEEFRVAATILAKMATSSNTNLPDQLLWTRCCVKGDVSETTTAFRHLAEYFPYDILSVTARLQYHLQTGDHATAAAIAREYTKWSSLNERSTHLALLALSRSGDYENALSLLNAYNGEVSAPIGEVVLRILATQSLWKRAATFGEKLILENKYSAEIYAHTAYALLEIQEYSKADVYLDKSLKTRPDDVRALSVRGERRLKAGDNDQAIVDLEKALEKAPHLSHIRLNYARALKTARRYREAADEFVAVWEADPESETLRRFAAAALNQAGDTQAATLVYDRLLLKREQALPTKFEVGLSNLWNRLNEVNIPKERFDWAWKLRDQGMNIEREEWENRARWGNLADHYIYDWLECRTDEAEQVMGHLSDVDTSTSLIREIMSEENGMLVASAHIGMMYAGPLVLELLGLKSKWLASTPALPTVGFYNQLISTSDQTEAQVVRKALQAITEGCAVTIAIDGAMHAAAPRIKFEGQNITYSSFAARLAYRKKTRSVFATPQWRNNWIEIYLRELPFPREGETINDFCERWQVGYFDNLRVVLGMEPENLRLSGGIWRNIHEEF